MNKTEIKLVIAIAIFVFIAVKAYASSVSTTDGKNFNVTNDAGYTWPMTNQAIEQKINQFNRMVAMDTSNLGSDQESLVLWNGVEQMAVNAASQINGAH